MVLAEHFRVIMIMMMMLVAFDDTCEDRNCPLCATGVDRPDINDWLKEQVSVAEAKANSARPHDSAQQSLGTMHCEQTHVGYKNIQCNLWINTLASSLLSFV